MIIVRRSKGFRRCPAVILLLRPILIWFELTQENCVHINQRTAGALTCHIAGIGRIAVEEFGTGILTSPLFRFMPRIVSLPYKGCESRRTLGYREMHLGGLEKRSGMPSEMSALCYFVKTTMVVFLVGWDSSLTAQLQSTHYP